MFALLLHSGIVKSMEFNLQNNNYYRLHNFADVCSCMLPTNTDVDGLGYLIADF
jgi:hypothetical protein